ncbi:globin domain-containing protein [Nocardia macrotermitis]|uniref:nitric oxide dioxygenase n=1 Tax=Nocardia macrotermitis TaxID=2585198 RepID=A0A7K0DE14_9NOCA|nr:globin domain-containing protein [Nocardia macrotermitis]MQY24043.1 Flavohemoprotein [Nocardia macrotermitis]
MDSRATAMVRTTFKAVAADEEGPGKVAGSFYAILFSAQPQLREYFPASLDTERERLVKALAHMVDRLDEPDELLPFLAQLGRDHRKYGIGPEHYPAVGNSLISAVRTHARTELWTEEVERAWQECVELITRTMLVGAQDSDLPAVWSGTVIEHRRVLNDLAVVRVRLDQPMRYAAGQYLSVQIPARLRMWRYLSPAVPPNAEGELEFHVRGRTGGWVSPALVGHTDVGDRWLLSAPMGGLGVPRNTRRKLLMIGCGTGIAPLRAQLVAMARRRSNPRVHLFVGGHHPCDLYDLEILSELAVANKWLTVTPIVESDENPWWHFDSVETSLDLPGLDPCRTGRIGAVVAGYGPWADRDIQISGSPSMVQTTKFRLMAAGTPAANIRHDPMF